MCESLDYVTPRHVRVASRSKPVFSQGGRICDERGSEFTRHEHHQGREHQQRKTVEKHTRRSRATQATTATDKRWPTANHKLAHASRAYEIHSQSTVTRHFSHTSHFPLTPLFSTDPRPHTSQRQRRKYRSAITHVLSCVRSRGVEGTTRMRCVRLALPSHVPCHTGRRCSRNNPTSSVHGHMPASRHRPLRDPYMHVLQPRAVRTPSSPLTRRRAAAPAPPPAKCSSCAKQETMPRCP